MPDRALAEGQVRFDTLFRHRLKVALHSRTLATSRVKDHTGGAFLEGRPQMFRRHRKSRDKFGPADDWREVTFPEILRISFLAVEEKKGCVAGHDADRELAKVMERAGLGKEIFKY